MFISNIKQQHNEIHLGAYNVKTNEGSLFLISEWFNATPKSQNFISIFCKGPLIVIWSNLLLELDYYEH